MLWEACPCVRMCTLTCGICTRPPGEKKKTGKYSLKTNASVCVRVYMCVWMADRKGRADREGKAEGVKVLLLKQAIYKKRLQACCQITQYARACTRTHTHTAHQTGCVRKGDRKWQSEDDNARKQRGKGVRPHEVHLLSLSVFCGSSSLHPCSSPVFLALWVPSVVPLFLSPAKTTTELRRNIWG